MVYPRPADAAYPQVWSRFTSPTGTRYRIQDLTEDQVEEAVTILKEHFVNDEPPCKHIGLRNHPTALAELVKLWKTTIDDQLSLVCVEDVQGPTRMVGVNVLTVARRDDKEEPFESPDDIWSMLFGAVDLVSRSVDLFSKYKVDRYLTAYGLVVPPKFRGQTVGLELLKARIPLCKALDIKLTATVFTAIASQKVAQKAGFVELSEIPYEEMARKHGFIFPGVENSTKSSKLMALLIQ